MKLLISVLFLGLVSCASYQVSGDRQVASNPGKLCGYVGKLESDGENFLISFITNLNLTSFEMMDKSASDERVNSIFGNGIQFKQSFGDGNILVEIIGIKVEKAQHREIILSTLSNKKKTSLCYSKRGSEKIVSVFNYL